MSLYLVKTIAPAFRYPEATDRLAYPSYAPPGGCWTSPPVSWPRPGDPTGASGGVSAIYKDYLATCPRHYVTAISSLSHIFYEPSTDKLYSHLLFDYAFWPGWDARVLIFDAEGVWLNQASFLSGADDSFCGVWGADWTTGASAGSFGRIYGSSLGIPKSMNPINAMPDGVWQNTFFDSLVHVIVNAAEGYLAEGSGSTLNCWRNIATTPEKYATLYLPTWLDSMSYENEEILWAIGRDGTILKINYKIPRIEMVSAVQSPDPSVLGYRITFDLKRHRVVVLRWLPDTVDGAATSQLEFYYPMNRAVTLTKPVPYTSLRAGKRIGFVAHLIGDRGEGIIPWSVTAALAAPAQGRLINTTAHTELGGRVLFQYEAPLTGCIDETIQLSATTEDV